MRNNSVLASPETHSTSQSLS